jgi:hypothetical protein
MTYNSVAEIYDSLDETRERLRRSVEHLEGEEEAFRPVPDRWSPAEIIEHLSIVEGRVVQLCQSLLGKAEARGHTRTEGAAFAPVSIEEFVEQTREQKLTAPDELRPSGLALADALARLDASRAALLELRPRVESADGSQIKFPHPAWGPLNLYQWLLFVGAHESRHLAQIVALKETMNA